MAVTKRRESGATKGRPGPDVWDTEAKRLVKGAMQIHGYTFKSLARALEVAGDPGVTAAAVALRINRGAFNMGFALRVLRVMGVRAIDISHVKQHEPGGTR